MTPDFDAIAATVSPDQLARAVGAEKSGTSYRCPLSSVHANGDRNASFTISHKDGRTVANCFGCGLTGSPVQIAAQVWNLEPEEAARRLADQVGLTTDRGGGEVPRSGERLEQPNTPEKAQSPKVEDRSTGDGNGVAKPEQPLGCTLLQYAEAKRLTVDFLKEVGVSEIAHHPAAEGPAIRIPYYWPDGSEASVQYRISLGSRNRFRFKSGTKPLLYGLEQLQAARDAEYVVLAEGTSDVHTLRHHGIPALGLPGATTWREAWAEYLDGVARIYVIDEKDTGAKAIRKWLAGSSIRHRVQFVRLGDYKDPSELHVQDPGSFDAAWVRAIETAEAWTDQAEAERQVQARDEFAKAELLLTAPNVLEQAKEAIRANGYAGCLDAPCLVFIALLSRLLGRPMNLALVAPSAAGKNRAVDEALRLTPAEGFHVLKAGSALALVYTDEDFTHRTVVVAEADSLPEDGPSASAVRSIAEDNFMEYQVVEMNSKTKEWGTRTVRKDGPTGIITTSTRPLGPQFGTRTLEVPVPDDDEQTRKILDAHAQEAAGSAQEPRSPDAFHSMQRWLELAGECRVVVPFAPQIAELIPPKAVALRRHVRQLFTCVKTIAFLHQLSRERDADGKVVATMDDYATARELLAPLFQSVVSEGLTDALRETTEAVKEGETVSVSEIARRLGISKSATSSRVKRCIREGWLQNQETRRGHAAQIKIGSPLPDTTTGLPEPDAVLEAYDFGRTLAGADVTPQAQAPEGLTANRSGVHIDSMRGAAPSPPQPVQEGLFPSDPEPMEEEAPWTSI